MFIEYQNVPITEQLRRIPKSAFIFVFDYDGEQKCLKKSKSLRQIAKGANLFLSTTVNRKVSLNFFLTYGELQKRCFHLFFAYVRRIRQNMPFFFRLKAATIFFGCGEKCCAPKIAFCASRNQPRGGYRAKRLFWPNATAQQLINALIHTSFALGNRQRYALPCCSPVYEVTTETQVAGTPPLHNAGLKK